MFDILEFFEFNAELWYLPALAALFALLAARFLERRRAAEVTTNPLEIKRSGRKDQSKMVFKKCPQCSEQLPLSTLVCESCDYNFLAGSILRHKLLPGSHDAMNHEATPLAHHA